VSQQYFPMASAIQSVSDFFNLASIFHPGGSTDFHLVAEILVATIAWSRGESVKSLTSPERAFTAITQTEPTGAEKVEKITNKDS
tara:strand:- start:146 stop:400 length:255 start_codon:yes stop_codon:yes gene_type:complete